MSAILAIWLRDGTPIDERLAGQLLQASPERSRDGQTVWSGGPVALAQQHFRLRAEDWGATQPLVDDSAEIVLASDTRLDNRAELARQCGLPLTDTLTDAELIIAAYRRWDVDCVAHLRGDFALALWDGAQHQLFFARDPLGVRDLAYYVTDRLCLVASTLPAILAHPAVRRRLNETKIALFLANVWRDGAMTFYEDVWYCPPGHCGLVSAESFRLWRYWDLDPARQIRYRDDRAYADHLRQLLEAAVANRLRGLTTPVGVSLSGGPDSATVAALAARLAPARAPVRTFSYVFDRYPACDERAYIRPLVEQYQLEATFLPGDDLWPLRDPATWPVFTDFAGQDPFVRLPLRVMQAAQAAGCRLLLSGHFGDVLLAGGEFWAAGMLQARAWRLLAETIRQLPDAAERRAQVWDRGLRPLLPRRLKAAFRRRRPRPLPSGLQEQISADFIQRTHLLQAWQTPPRQHEFSAPAQWERYQYLTGSGEAQGLAAARALYQQHGLELVDPLLDRDLVEFALAVPAHQLARPPFTKWVLRQAVADLIPPSVAWRRDKTSLYPLFRDGLLQHAQTTVRELVAQPRCVALGYINPAWLATEAQAGDGWTDYGFPFWQTLALELWLRRVT